MESRLNLLFCNRSGPIKVLIALTDEIADRLSALNTTGGGDGGQLKTCRNRTDLATVINILIEIGIVSVRS